jgi:hypothetical protein
MATPSLTELRTHLETIDACLRKYVRLRAQLIEVIAFMEDEKEQEFLRTVREKRSAGMPETDATEAARNAMNGMRPKMPAPVPDQFAAAPPRQAPNNFSTTLSMEA